MYVSQPFQTATVLLTYAREFFSSFLFPCIVMCEFDVRARQVKEETKKQQQQILIHVVSE